MSYQINIYYQNSRKTIILNWLSTSFNPIECIDLFEKNQLDIIVAIRIFKLSTIKNQKIESKSKYNCLVKLASLYAPDQIMNSYQLYQSSDIKFLLIEVLLFSLVVNKSDTTINKNILDDVINRIRYLNYDFFNLSTLHDFHQSFGEYLFQDHQSKSIQKVLFQFKNIIGYIFQNRWFDFIINNNDENRFLLDRPSYENPKERITEIQILNFLKNMNKYLEFKVSYDYLSVKSITLTEHDILHPVDNVFTIDTYMKSIVILNRIITLFHESDEKIEIEKEVKTILGLLESDIDMILPIDTQ